MKIAIHHETGTFSRRWIDYCTRQQIDYKIVDCYQNNIIEVLSDCDALMWHFDHEDYRDALFAKQLLFAVESSGKAVFPNFKTCWHFDDKVGQKYLLEAIGAPLVPTNIFYSSQVAINWADRAEFPQVFKLRGGAGSANVRLVQTKRNARKLIKRAFRGGFQQFDGIAYFKDRLNKYLAGRDSLLGVFKGFARIFVSTTFSKMKSPEKGYIYFQSFIPNASYDIRVIVIEDKAFAIKRIVRRNDFRASGSGSIKYSRDNFDERLIRLSFEISDSLESQCVAFDFVYDENAQPLLVELSYGFSQSGYEECVGYWDKELAFHGGKFNPQEWMVANLVNKARDLSVSKPAT